MRDYSENGHSAKCFGPTKACRHGFTTTAARTAPRAPRELIPNTWEPCASLETFDVLAAELLATFLSTASRASLRSARAVSIDQAIVSEIG
jgi:hypothetical protein